MTLMAVEDSGVPKVRGAMVLLVMVLVVMAGSVAEGKMAGTITNAGHLGQGAPLACGRAPLPGSRTNPRTPA